MAKGEDKTEKIYELLLEVDQRVVRMEEHMVTKGELTLVLNQTKTEILHDVKGIVDSAVDAAKEELFNVIKPMSKAQDSDSKVIIDHGHRIATLEKGRSAASLS